MAKATAKALTAAREQALQGNAEAALAELEAMAEAGSASAAASVAELAAFGGDWLLVAQSAASVLREPTAVYAGNVIDDMVRLLGRAGHEGVPWASVADAASAALSALAASDQKEHSKKRLATIFGALRDYAGRAGAPPHELIQVFGVAPRAPDPAAFKDGLERTAERLDPAAKPREYLAAAIALAVSYAQPDEIVRLYEAHAAHANFASAVEAARVRAAHGDAAAAWSAIEATLSSWYPADLAQVAPIVLVTDDVLRTLGTPERWRQVLATPRAGKG